MIEDVIQYLDSILTATGYYTKQWGYIEIITQGDSKFPAKYKSGGKHDDISTFNRYNGVAYFRRTGPFTASPEESNLISCKRMIDFTLPIRLVSIIKKNQLKTDNPYSNDELALDLVKLLSAKESGLRNTLKAKRVEINPSSWTTDAVEIFSEEYAVQGNNQIDPKYSYIAIDLDVNILITRECIETYCSNLTDCDILLGSLTDWQLIQCVLGWYDFSDTTVQDALSAQQKTDLTNYLCTNDITTELIYNSASTDVIEDTSVNANYAGTYTTENLTNVATVQYEIDTGGGYAVETLPFTLSAGDGFKVTITRTVPATESIVQINGTY